MCCQSDSGFSRRLQFLLMRQFRQRAAHRFPGQARIRVHDFGDRQAGGERLQDERHGNARAAHTRASAQMFRVSDNPILHAVKLWQMRNKSSIRVAFVDHIKNFFAHKIKKGGGKVKRDCARRRNEIRLKLKFCRLQFDCFSGWQGVSTFAL
jgi:hypothetical protein